MTNRAGSYYHGLKAVELRKKSLNRKKRRKAIATDLRIERQAQAAERIEKARAAL